MKLSGIKYELYYSFTGIDAPEIVQFIRSNYPKCKFLLPKEHLEESKFKCSKDLQKDIMREIMKIIKQS